MKETYYFQHDYNARNDDKILELRGAFQNEGYAIFRYILETMAENEDGGLKRRLIGGLSLGYGVSTTKLSEIVDFCINIGLFYEIEGVIYSKRMIDHKNTRKALSDAGRKGAQKMWKNREANGHPNAKERKGKEIDNNILLLSLEEFIKKRNAIEKIGERKGLPKNIKVTQEIKKAWNKKYKEYSMEEFDTGLNNYCNEILHRKRKDENDTYPDHRFTILEFLTRERGLSKFINL